MFFKKWREKRRKEEEESFESILRKHELIFSSARIDNLDKHVYDLSAAVRRLERICAHYIPGQITGVTEFSDVDGLNRRIYDLLVYKNGNEYRVKGLYVKDPHFTQGDSDTTIYVKSKATGDKYAIDLSSGSAVKIFTGDAASDDDSGILDYETYCKECRKKMIKEEL